MSEVTEDGEKGGDTSAPKTTELKLFKDVKYYVIGSLDESVESLLEESDAEVESYLTDRVTHVIATESDHPEISEAKDLFELPVVSPQWISMSVRCRKLLPTKAFAPETSKLFSNINACLSQMPQGDRNALWAMLAFYGGSCQLSLNKKCTHLVTPKTDGAKYACATRHESTIKIVTPDWVVDSINNKKLQDEKIYHPKLILDKPEEVSPTEKETAAADVKTEQLSQESIVEETSQSSSSGPSVVKASKAQYKITAPWAEDVEKVSDILLSGQDKPPKEKKKRRPRKKKEPALTITHESLMGNFPEMEFPRTLRNITNNGEHAPQQQGGERRQLSQVLSAIAGMASQNKAREQTLSTPLLPEVRYYGHDPSYSIMPETCMLGCIFLIIEYPQLVGQQYIDTWRKVISDHGGIVDDCYSDRITHVLCDTQKSEVFKLATKDGKRCVTANWLNDCLKMKKMQPPWRALHFPVTSYPLQPSPCRDQIIAVTGFEGIERNDVKTLVELSGAKYTGFFSRGNTLLICNRQEGSKYEKALEWRKPYVNVQWLSDNVLGNIENVRNISQLRYQTYDLADPFKIDQLQRMPLMEPWTTPLKISQALRKSFISALGEKGDPLASKRLGSPIADQHSKKQRTEGDLIGSQKMLNNKPMPHVMFTGCDPKMVPDLAKKVERLGGQVVTKINLCTHLVASKVTRTMKFLCGVSVCRHIITPQWVEESHKNQWLLDEANFNLVDSEQEKLFTFRLKDSMQKAHQRKVFQNITFYVSSGVKPGLDTMKEIIECAGGILLPSRPSLKTVGGILAAGGPGSFVVITCDTDLPLCRDFLRHKIEVHNAEFILTGVLRQQLDFQSFKFHGF
ncbi:PAX-interacting protein 1-like [Amphiura filiformis]|uniref:PAX-interacting protein 1-like n=1 Tax=Amphiura filiformis TaxID=82378 RepID=UPI003B20D33F